MPLKLKETNISNEHNRLKNPNWREADQLAIYKHDRGVGVAHLVNISIFSSNFPELLKVIRETENDDLTGVMQKLISTYGDQEQVASIAVDIARDLVSQFRYN